MLSPKYRFDSLITYTANQTCRPDVRGLGQATLDFSCYIARGLDEAKPFCLELGRSNGWMDAS